jgi:hypothetical protein
MQRALSLSALAFLLALAGGTTLAHAEERDHGGDNFDHHGQGGGGNGGGQHENGNPGNGGGGGFERQGDGHEHVSQPHGTHGNGHQNHGVGHANNSHGGGNQGVHRNNFARSSRPVPAHFQHLGVQHMPAGLQRGQLLRADAAHSTMRWPQRGPHGESLHVQGARINGPLVHGQLRAIASNRAVLSQIRGFNASERVAGRYYWHSFNGQNYCHYYDHWGFHWYGWYVGNSCFWVRQYNGGWWWHDPLRARWCYWYDGFWWWQNPDDTTVVYVYNGDDYVPSDPGVQGQAPAMAAPSDGGSAPAVAPSMVTPIPAAPGEIPSLPQDEGPQQQEETAPAGASGTVGL